MHVVVNHLHLREPPTDASVQAAGPWTREHIVPLLERGTERSAGELIAPARA
ncbi:MAG TPA: hypothetical protein VLA22_08545 [Gaiellaceae bacterium]|nr:hypothetical protein [Gaiellaceae bacterium]